ncbi:hypothetical protein TCAL_03033 [Tigriopus californicus]|uniref:Peptidase S1 domain-containing protein n=1 Tax=Tigriopus californicus TaxID=6832 RepID=A0A553NVH3_TIGCA|nr:hypothetical protein TCAL_03033 [Tigriopus californicus]
MKLITKVLLVYLAAVLQFTPKTWSRQVHLGPSVDPGVFVITQVDSCRGGRGYCVLGFNCNIDKDFVADDLNGHCDGLELSTNAPMMSPKLDAEPLVAIEQVSTPETVSTTPTTDKEFQETPLDNLVSSLLDAVVPALATEMPSEMAPPLPISASVVPSASALTELRLIDEQEEAEEMEILRPGTIIDDPTLLEDLVVEQQDEQVRPRIDDTESLVDVIRGFEPQSDNPQEEFKSTQKSNDQKEAKVDCYAAILLGIECKLAVPPKIETGSAPPANPGTKNPAEEERSDDQVIEEQNNDQVIMDQRDDQVMVEHNNVQLMVEDSDEQIVVEHDNLESFPPGKPQALVDESQTDPPIEITTTESTTQVPEIVTVTEVIEEILDDEIKTTMIDMKPERDDPLIKMTTYDPTIMMEDTTTPVRQDQVTNSPSLLVKEDLTPIGLVNMDTEQPEHIELPEDILMTNPTSMPLTTTTTQPTEIKSAYRRITDAPKVKTDPKPDTCGVLGGRGLLQAFGKAAEGLLPDLVASWVTGHHGGKEEKSSEFIGGGVVTSTVIYCWMAAILTEVNGQKEFLCTGTLIKTNVVLVSATCATELVNRNPSDIKVVLGDSNLSIDLPFGVQTLDVSMIHIHDQFSPYVTELEHNVGLIRLKKKASLTNTVCLLCPPSARTQPKVNQTCSIISYGKIVEKPIDLPFEVTSQKSTGILRKSEYIIRNPNECHANVSRTDGMVCAREIEHLTLNEQRHKREHCHIVIDSGSPLICQNNDRFELQGLLTGGHTCLGPNEEVTFTKVEPYNAWIEKKSSSKS